MFTNTMKAKLINFFILFNPFGKEACRCRLDQCLNMEKGGLKPTNQFKFKRPTNRQRHRFIDRTKRTGVLSDSLVICYNILIFVILLEEDSLNALDTCRFFPIF